MTYSQVRSLSCSLVRLDYFWSRRWCQHSFRYCDLPMYYYYYHYYYYYLFLILATMASGQILVHCCRKAHSLELVTSEPWNRPVHSCKRQFLYNFVCLLPTTEIKALYIYTPDSCWCRPQTVCVDIASRVCWCLDCTWWVRWRFLWICHQITIY